MNPYSLLGIIALSTTIIAGIVLFTVSLGVPVLFAFFGVYIFSGLIMIRMVKGAPLLNDDCEIAEQGDYIEDQFNVEAPACNPTENVEPGVTKKLA